jgi:hypothetical protein
MEASGGQTESMAALTTTAEPIPVGSTSVFAVQAVAAAKGSDACGGCSVGANATKAQEPGSSHQEEGVVGALPVEEAKEDVASGAKHTAPGAEYAIDGGMTIGGQSSGVGASGGPAEPTSAMHGASGTEHEMAIGGKISGVGASGGPAEPTSASTMRTMQVFVVASSVVAIQTVAAAEGSDAV